MAKLLSTLNNALELKKKSNELLINDRLISFHELKAIHGFSRATIWRWEKMGKHPQRRQIGSNSVRWLLSEIMEWMENSSVVE